MTSQSRAAAAGQRQDLYLLAAISLPVLLLLAAYLITRNDLERRYAVPAEEIAVPQGSAALAEGARLARIRGCYWCHGEQMQGKAYFADATRGIILITPNLSETIPAYSSADFVAAVRYGVRPDGTSLQPAMPSFAYYNMSDEDLGLIFAYLKSLAPVTGFTAEYRLMPLGWIRWALRRFPGNVADLIDHDLPRPDPAVAGSPTERGRYLAESICTECHGDNGRLRVPVTPDLTIALSYTRDEFFHLMRTGEARHERPLDYHMVEVSQFRYGAMTDKEIDSLYAYFQSMLNVARLAENE
jgi:mono/diheme cytochrome c family protein